MPSRPGRCPDCGFDAAAVSPADAAVAARSYPRRYRALLVRPDEDDPEIVHRRPAPDQLSAVEHTARAAVDISAAADALRRVRIDEDPEVALEGTAPIDEAGPTSREVLAVLDAAAASFATVIETLRGDEWRRSGHLAGGGDVGALDVARHGVHAGIHHLRAAERALAGARLRRT